MPALATDGGGATQWFSKLLDECYFRLPQFRDDLQSYHSNCEGEDKQNLAVIYADVIRQQTQLFRQGKLIGADEYAEDAHKARCVITSDARVNAWQAFDAYARKQLHMSSTDYGMELQLDDEAKALFDELVQELGALYTEGARTPAENFEVASKACKILFTEEHQNNANESSSDGDGEDGEGSQDGSAGDGDGEASGDESTSAEAQASASAEAEWSERDGSPPDTHLIGENQRIEGLPPERGSFQPGKVDWVKPHQQPNEGRVREVQKVSGFQLSTKVRNLLKILSQVRWTGGHKRGRINKRRIATIPNGNTTVFRQKHKREVLDTAVTLLVDCSGSMGGTRYTSAVAASAALVDVLTGLHMPHEVLGFTYTYHSVGYEFSTFKEFHSRDEIVDIMCRDDVRLAGNADADVLVLAHDRLLAQKQKRKVLIVLSDGQPVDGDNPVGNLKLLAKEIEDKSPVELYSIGIESRQVKRFYSNSRTINDASELEPTLISLLKEAVIK